MPCDELFGELVRIARDKIRYPDPAERSALIATRMKPSTISLELRACLRKKLRTIPADRNSHEIIILQKGFELSNEFNKRIHRVNLQRSDGTKRDLSDIEVFGNPYNIGEKIEIRLGEEIIYAETIHQSDKAWIDPPPPSRVSNRGVIFGRELE